MIKYLQGLAGQFDQADYQEHIIALTRKPQNQNQETLAVLNTEFVKSLTRAERSQYTETLIVFNEQKKRLGKVNYLLTMKAGLIHAGVNLFLTDLINQKILLQRRHPKIEPHGNRWDISCGGNLSAESKSFWHQARIELWEELGITDEQIDLQQRIIKFDPYRYDSASAFTSGSKKTIFHLFSATLKNADKININFNKKEVSEIKWFTLDEIKQLPEEQIAHGLEGALKKITLENLFNRI
jgi:isopentenyldiphosphate isomerase